MINTITSDKRSKFLVDDLINNIYLLPKWEKIKSFSVTKRKFWFKHESLKLDLCRKFSSKNMLEKYSIKTSENNVIATMDLRIYKDCVYIINMNFATSFNEEQIVLTLLQTALEKALYNTKNKEVKINLNFEKNINNKLKKILEENDFTAETNQSEYEIEMFGKTFYAFPEKSSFWTKRIKNSSILINK